MPAALMRGFCGPAYECAFVTRRDESSHSVFCFEGILGRGQDGVRILS
jgi:hypothetical protein